MDSYVTGAVIKRLREEKHLSQAGLADRLGVTDKAVSKWETGRGYPDITLLEPLARALGVTIMELLNGSSVINRNRAGNMAKTNIHVCPLCGNLILSSGDALVCCCGITLPALEAEACDEDHAIRLEKVEDEVFVSMAHPMTKEHYISFFLWLTGDEARVVKLYPEGNAEARFKLRGHGTLTAYCNRHGLMKTRV